MEDKEIRWKQRFVNFEKAFKLLANTIKIKSPNEVEKAGMIQFYEMCFELSWKLLKDYLESEGFMVKSPRDTLKQAYQVEIIDNGEVWLQALEDRNLTAHTYDEATAILVIGKISGEYYFELEKLYEFFLKKYE